MRTAQPVGHDSVLDAAPDPVLDPVPDDVPRRLALSPSRAADFKQCPETKRMLFLEVNSGPMFAAFDAVSERAVSRAIVRALVCVQS